MVISINEDRGCAVLIPAGMRAVAEQEDLQGLLSGD